MSNEVQTKPESGVITLDQLEQHAGEGFEEVSSKDLSVPYLTIIQKQSGYMEPTHKAYVEGAKVGDFINTMTQRIYSGSEGLTVVPCYFRSTYVEREGDDMGPFVAEHPASTPLKDQTVRKEHGDFLENGHILTYTSRIFIFIPSTLEPAIITLRSTGHKESRKWVSALESRKVVGKDGKPFCPPFFSNLSIIRTTPESNPKGTWHALSVSPHVGEVADQAVFDMAVDFADMVRKGGVQGSGDE